MKKYYSSLSKDELLEMLPNRTWSSVLTKANKININKRCMWTNEEDNLLIAIYENTDINEVVKKFSNRDKNSIVKRAMKLGLNSYNHPIWTKEDELYIINNWQLLPDEIIAQNIYGELDNIPEICIDDTGSRSRVNFALRPRGINKITDLEIWEYNLKNEPIDMLIYVGVDDYWFKFLKTDVFDEEIILDIYNYCV